MPERASISFPAPASETKTFSKAHFLDEQADRAIFSGFRFEFCTLEKIGLREAKFNQCVFKHCDFIDCYLVRCNFAQCDFVGSTFENCNFTWAEFPGSKLDYTHFLQCAPVLVQVLAQKPQDPQASTKFFRNLAMEHKNLGNWEEVDRLIKQSYRERERHYWSAMVGANDHYKMRYGGFSKRFRYGLRFFFSLLSRIVWGNGVSWTAFLWSLLTLTFIILTFLNATIGTLTDRPKYFWTANPPTDVARYLALLYKTTALTFMPFLPSSLVTVPSDIRLPFLLVFGEALAGTLFIAMLASLLFRRASRGV